MRLKIFKLQHNKIDSLLDLTLTIEAKGHKFNLRKYINLC